MSTEPEPLDVLRADVERAARRKLRNLGWWRRKWPGVQLITLLLGGSVSIGLLWAAFPYAVAAAATVAFAALAGYAIYVRKQLVDERAVRRWAWVAGKRVHV